MGMYTELVLKVDVKRPPEPDASVLRYLFGDGEEPEILPDHPFFSLGRWSMIGHCSSYYHHPEAMSDLHVSPATSGWWNIFSRSDIKNYESEIEHFLDWVAPLVDASDGDCIGWYWYEEFYRPTLLIYRESPPRVEFCHCDDVATRPIRLA